MSSEAVMSLLSAMILSRVVCQRPRLAVPDVDFDTPAAAEQHLLSPEAALRITLDPHTNRT